MLLDDGEDVGLVEGVAGVTEVEEIASQGELIFGAVHLADDDGVPLAQSVCRAMEDFVLRALHIALDEIGSGVRGAIVVEGYGVDMDYVRIPQVIRGYKAEAAIGGFGEIGANKRNGGRFGPDGLFLDEGLAEIIVRQILA